MSTQSKTFKVRCNGTTGLFPEQKRGDQIDFYAHCVKSSEGNDKKRYNKILSELINGCEWCSDQEE